MFKVSVIIPTRNRCKLLPRAVDSARRAGCNVEIVVVDDASEDETPEVCARLADVRIVRSRHRRGPAGARNIGMIASTSPYISFLDDDDLRLPGSLDAQLRCLEVRPEAGMIYGRALYGDQEYHATGDFYPDRFPQGDIFWELMSWNFIPCPTAIFRRECLTRLGLLDEEATGVEDWDWWIRIAEMYPVLAMGEAVAIWRKPTPTSDQFTSSPQAMHKQIERLHRDKWLRLPRAAQAGAGRRREANRDFARKATQQLIWESADRLKLGRHHDFMRIWFALVRLYPLSVLRTAFDTSSWRSVFQLARHMRQGVSHLQ